jgi:hypothetical protein
LGRRFEALRRLLMAAALAGAAIEAAVAQTPAPNPARPAETAADRTIQVNVQNAQGAATTADMRVLDDSGSAAIVEAPNGMLVAVDSSGNILGEAEKTAGGGKGLEIWSYKKLSVPLNFLAPAAIRLPAIPDCFAGDAAKKTAVDQLYAILSKASSEVSEIKSAAREGKAGARPEEVNRADVNQRAAYRAWVKVAGTPTCTREAGVPNPTPAPGRPDDTVQHRCRTPAEEARFAKLSEELADTNAPNRAAAERHRQQQDLDALKAMKPCPERKRAAVPPAPSGADRPSGTPPQAPELKQAETQPPQPGGSDGKAGINPAGPSWYYCYDPPGYYPAVATCKVPWHPVPAAERQRD